MALLRSPEPRTLRTLNRVLAGWFDGDATVTEDLNATLELLELEDESVSPAPWDTARLGAAARHLLRLHAPRRRFGGPELGLIDFRGEPFEPLFARVRVLDALAGIPADADAVLWVTGLKETLLAGARRRHPRAVAEYLAAQSLIEDIAAGSGRDAKLVFL